MSLFMANFLACLCLWGVIPAESSGLTKPWLAPFQDMSKCDWEGSTWYLLYRTSEDSPFGKDARCINILQVTPVVNDEMLMRFSYTPKGEKNATFRFKSSTPGGPKNVVRIKLDKEGSKEKPFKVLYSDCESCLVLKHVTADNRSLCLQYVHAKALNKAIPQCHFVYDAECGQRRKYHISDKSCLSMSG
ncbi:uncharacterized protein LOC144157860 [Haemaphysalis longicornis]